MRAVNRRERRDIAAIQPCVNEELHALNSATNMGFKRFRYWLGCLPKVAPQAGTPWFGSSITMNRSTSCFAPTVPWCWPCCGRRWPPAWSVRWPMTLRIGSAHGEAAGVRRSHP